MCADIKLPHWHNGCRMNGDGKLQLPDHTSGKEQDLNNFRLLKNPLPAPVRRSHVRMEFDLEEPDGEGSETEFDYLISDDDDFDI